jgi:hypothetical protein
VSRRKPPQTYNVVNDADGSLVVIGVDLATARSEQARLNAEANHAGMHMGTVTQHAIQTTSDPVTIKEG